MVSLPRLRLFRISAKPAYAILLNHLHIPTSASATLEFQHNRERFSFSDYLPRSLGNLGNVSHITPVNLSFNPATALRLEGPSGGFYMISGKDRADFAFASADPRTFQTLNVFNLLTVESLAIAEYDAPVYSNTEGSAVYQTLLAVKNLRAVALTHGFILPLIYILDPNQNASNTVVCPKLEEFVLFTQDKSYIEELLEMAKGRASRSAKLLLINLTCPRNFAPAEKVSELRGYASRVEYRSGGTEPDWYTIPGEVGEVDYPSDWWN